MIDPSPLPHRAFPSRQDTARRELMLGGTIFLGIAMFVGTGSGALTQAFRAITGDGGPIDTGLVVAMLLNVALVLFGWRRHRDLRQEIEDRSQAEERARILADTDPLTGLVNRRSVAVKGAALLVDARKRGRAVAALLLDLDRFKNVNDVHGHATGDTVLTTVASRITAVLPPRALLARLGGDEFVALLTFDPDRPDLIERIAADLVGAMVDPITFEQMQVTVCTSLGIARSEDGVDDVGALLRRADIAMYASKAQGRNRYCWFNARMEQELKVRSSIEQGIRIGLPRGEFVPYFEQQIDLATGRLAGFEMLMRWESATQGTISPDVFIPIAEETGLIADLSLCVMRQAMHDAMQWDQSLTLAVNVSPVQLKDPWFAQKIVKLLVETGFPASRLEVEITESSLFDNLPLAQSIIGSLKNQGISLALDDFGTGYSSLSHLRALPFDRIKIDRSFVSAMTTSQDAAAIVNAIAGLGRSLGMPVTAEGIEDAEIERQLVRFGCAKGQGWHFGRPLPATRVLELLAERGLRQEQSLAGEGLGRQPSTTPGPVANGMAALGTALAPAGGIDPVDTDADDWIEEDNLLTPLRRAN